MSFFGEESFCFWPRGPFQHKDPTAVVLNLFTERSQSWLITLLESLAKEILTQVKCHVLLYSRTKSATQNIRCLLKD